MRFFVKAAVRDFSLFALLVVLFLGAGCAATAKAPLTADGGQISIVVISDRGDPATMNEKQFEMRNQVGEWMERDLVNLLRKAGYEARLIQKPEEYLAGSGKYLLKVAIVSYNPGSKAARMVVGYGAGATSLDTKIELLGQGGKSLLTDELGVGSSRDWYYSARKVNELTVEAVSNRLKQQ